MLASLRPWLAATILGGVSFAVFVPALARADASSDAKDLFSRGRDMRARGDCAGAAILFRKAYEIYPSGLGSIRNLAECEEQLGHFASSRRSWLDLKRALLTTDDHKYASWPQDADQAAARLAPKVATVTIDLNFVEPNGSTSDGKGVDVSLDGESLATALLGTPLERDPGRHVVRVAGQRVHEPQERALDLAAGDAKRIALRVVVTPENVDPNDVVEASPAQTSADTGTQPVAEDGGAHARSMRRTLGWVAIGAGGAALVGAGISLGMRQSALSDLDNVCPSHTQCPSSERSTVNRGATASTLFDVLGVVGVLGVAGGAVLLTTAREPGPARAGLIVTPTLGGASATWRW